MTQVFSKQSQRKLVAISGMLMAALLMLPGGAREKNSAAAGLQARPAWTAVAATGVLDESSTAAAAFDATALGFRSTGTSIVARYNVTNIVAGGGNPNVPGWTLLELGSTAPAGSSVQAQLFKVDPCTGRQTPLCSGTPAVNAGAGGPHCRFCQFGPTAVDFTNALYYVEVTLKRSNTTLRPQAFTLRLK